MLFAWGTGAFSFHGDNHGTYDASWSESKDLTNFIDVHSSSLCCQLNHRIFCFILWIYSDCCDVDYFINYLCVLKPFMLGIRQTIRSFRCSDAMVLQFLSFKNIKYYKKTIYLFTNHIKYNVTVIQMAFPQPELVNL